MLNNIVIGGKGTTFFPISQLLPAKCADTTTAPTGVVDAAEVILSQKYILLPAYNDTGSANFRLVLL